MTDPGDPTERTTPPITPEEHAYIWRGVKRANEGWMVVGPQVAFVKNRWAWLAGAMFFLVLQSGDILAAVRAFMEVAP